LADLYSKYFERFAEQYEKVSPEKVNAQWSHFIPATKSLALDVGSGSGRDAAWLAEKGHEIIAVEPADKLRKKSEELHPHSSIHWINDSLPALKEVYKLNLRFDLILVSAVWMHIAPGLRDRSFRKLINLLRPGGKLILTLRHGISSDERTMYTTESEEIYKLANRYAVDVVLNTKSDDQLGRSEVSWTTMVLWLPDDGTGALPILRHVIINDAKSSTYKLALLRVLLRIADGSQGAVIDRTDNHVVLPFGLVALYWVKVFKSLVLDKEIPQRPSNAAKLSFDKTAFRSLTDISPYDLRIGAKFKGDHAKNLVLALRDARNTIKMMPAFYTTYPNSEDPVFPCRSKRITQSTSIKLDIDFLSRFGTFKVPIKLWDAMNQYACWIEPAILNEWCALMAAYETKYQKHRSLDVYLQTLSWLDKDHNTIEVRKIVEHMKDKGKKIFCVWTGDWLHHDYHIDHCFPFAHWPNNDLWNLMPTHPRINHRKSNKLPSAYLLSKAKDIILEWWNEAYSQKSHLNRFIIEAKASLPIVKQETTEGHFDNIFSGVQTQRIRLKAYQQLAEWDG
jgi:SAM-dependent methyltransferase